MNRPILRFTGLTYNRHPLPLVLGLLLISALLLAGCGQTESEETSKSSGSPTNSPVKKEGNYITADPNPVPAGPEPRGKTVISWKTQGYTADQVIIYVSDGIKPEVAFANGVSGSQDAPWIASDTPAEFRLYGGLGTNRKLLDKVVVTRNK